MTNEQKLEYILNAVANGFVITAHAIKSKSQKDDIVDARQSYYVLARRFTQCSFREIGERCGFRDSSTVSYGIKNVQRVMEKDETLRKTYEKVLSFLKNDRILVADYVEGAMRPKFPGLALLHVPYPSLMMQS